MKFTSKKSSDFKQDTTSKSQGDMRRKLRLMFPPFKWDPGILDKKTKH